ncbi:MULTISPECIES: anti-repressor SinI family protein [Bacillaceae]|uniref:Anti-repressor SinI family protein n=1 Tax=Evansella alkalicola TaxID=745819 RepID=A0ABS6JNG9_9BACI|nr:MULTISPECIES: anti-repressor SinI family protein [Bacillaceae]MBU9720103.1 anti-repressor SinI family protein [Bacillus alkalicola]
MHKKDKKRYEEWKLLIDEARKMGITPADIREFLKQKNYNLTS